MNRKQKQELFSDFESTDVQKQKTIFFKKEIDFIKKKGFSKFVDEKIKTIDFNFGYNLMLRDQPDYRVNPIAKSLGTNTPYTTAWRDTYRFWSVMDENSFNGSVNKDFGDIKIGGSYVKKMRNFQARIFRYDATDMLNEITNNTDRYTADFDLAGGYVSYDKMWGKIKLNGGLRTEYNLFNVGTSDFSGQKVNVDRNYLDFLPSVNLSYNLDKTKFRFSASKTLARPEFREVANFAYYDFVRNAQLLGNPNLEKSASEGISARSINIICEPLYQLITWS
jgi:hypothetical protein